MPDYSKILHYTAPARAFNEALPIGNGRLGAMIYGGVSEDAVGLNEDTIWSGYPRNDSAPGTPGTYGKIKEAVLNSRFGEAEELFESLLVRNESASFLPLGELTLSFKNSGEPKDYSRSLDLSKGCVTVSYRLGGKSFSREYIASYPHDALVIHLTCDRPHSLDFTLGLRSRLRSNVYTIGSALYIDGEAPSDCVYRSESGADEPVHVYSTDSEKRGVQFRGGAAVSVNGGKIISSPESDTLKIAGASEATVWFKVFTSFNGYERSPFLDGKEYYDLLSTDLEYLVNYSFDSVMLDHLSDFTPFFDRVTLTLPQSGQSALPTDKRLEAFEENPDDASLIALLFNYGRYLMISGSRPGSQPLNLQGIWNSEMFPPWRSNYTTNINTEMNYWPAEPANLAEFHLPLIEMIRDISEAGRATARDIYDAEGFCAHHNCDLWRKTTPPGRSEPENCSVFAFWPFSGGWLCRHLWEHYEYNPDPAFLRGTVYPILKECSRFFLSVIDECGEGLCFLGSSSPENRFVDRTGRVCAVGKYTTMSNAIMREVFTDTAKACDIIGDAEFAALVREKAARIVKYKLGSDGQILEYDDDYEENEPRHRHLSHLYGMYPGTEINRDDTPELAEAAKRTLERRGDEGTGWSLGWKLNLWARMRDGERAYSLIRMQLKPAGAGGAGTYPNLFDAHPPFQIDGNFAFTAGICEMLVQCRDGIITLLPALPRSLDTGSVSGLCLKGGARLSMSWSGGRLTEAVISPLRDFEAEVRCASVCRKVSFKAGEDYRFA